MIEGILACAVLDVHQTLAHKALVLSLLSLRALLSDQVVTYVYEGIPLIVASLTGLHPGSDRLQFAPIVGALEPILVVGLHQVQSDSSQLHIVDPVSLLVEVGLLVANAVECTRLSLSKCHCINSLLLHTLSKFGVELLEQHRTQCECRSILSCCRSNAGIAVLVLADTLNVASDEIYGTTLTGTPTIVYHIGVRLANTVVVAVVSNLVEHYSRVGIHSLHPLQAPTSLVENVGNAVLALVTCSVELIGELIGVLVVSKHHLEGSICRSQQILQLVGSIVPTATNVDILARTSGVVNDVTVVLVALLTRVGVVAAALLAHIVQRHIACVGVDIVADAEVLRAYVTNLDVVRALFAHLGEGQTIGALHTPDRGVLCDGLSGVNHLAATSLAYVEGSNLSGSVCNHNSHLGQCVDVADQVGADPTLSRNRCCCKQCNGQNSKFFHRIIVLTLCV